MPVKKIKLIKPTLYQDSICNLFGKEMASNQQDYYKERGEGNLDKLANWSYLGKMAEYAVFNTLLSYNKYKVVTPPDIAIYPKRYKSHDADLTADGRQIHVKCFMNSLSEPSWLFSMGDKICDNPLDVDIVSLVMTTPLGDFEAYFIPAKELVGMYKPPKLSKTVARALYESDIITM